jgi:two-component sensor histidine kinase
MTFAVELVVLILLLIIYNLYQLKQRKEVQLQEKQAEITKLHELLKKLLTEKEWLIREIHHRVKNNLQIVSSLLSTQSAHLKNKDAIEAIQNSQNRMYVISLIHKKLYQTEDPTTIDMKCYISDLTSYMKQCFEIDKKITFTIDTDSISLDVIHAIPLGLILNEAISNALKYAFPDNQQGEVLISLKIQSTQRYNLTISDNGIGFPKGYNLELSESLGMNLMKGLTEQLEGTFDVSSNNGLTININFPTNLALNHG